MGKKKKLTKEEKEALKREEEERRILQEELARQQAEEEERQRLERERLEREERERIRLEEAGIRDVQQGKLRSILSICKNLNVGNKKKIWYDIEWDHLMHRSGDPNALVVSVINGYVSEWKDDENEDTYGILQEIVRCLKLMEDIDIALVYFPEVTEKDEDAWQLNRSCMKEVVAEKLQTILSMLLMDSNDYISPDSFNSERTFIYPDDSENTLEDDQPFIISICIWVNLAKNARYKGMESSKMGLNFEMPRSLISVECAVLMMYTAFDHVTPTKLVPKSYLPLEKVTKEKIPEDMHSEMVYQAEGKKLDENEEEMPEIHEISEMKEISADILGVDSPFVDVTETKDIPFIEENICEMFTKYFVDSSTKHSANECNFVEKHEKRKENTAVMSAVVRVTINQIVEPVTSLEILHEIISESDVSAPVTPSPSTTALQVESSTSISSLIEPEIEMVDLSGYQVIGGIFHFNLMEVPHLPIKSGAWIMTYVEAGQTIQRMPYKATIIPIRQPRPGMSPAEAAEFADSEIRRFENEMFEAVTISLTLPNVIFLEQPIPAMWVDDRNGFTSSGFFDIKYEEEKGIISFKTNQFNKIGMMVRKYANFPLQFWELTPEKGSHHAILVIKGVLVSLNIEICDEGCSIKCIQQGDNEIFPHISDTYMAPWQLIQNTKWCFGGGEISRRDFPTLLRYAVGSFHVPMKLDKLSSIGINLLVEDDGYDHIGVQPKDLWTEDWTYFCMSILSNECQFSWSHWNMGAPDKELILKCTRIINQQRAQIPGSLIMVTPERAVHLQCTETSQSFSNEPIDGQVFCSDLYHLMINELPEEPLGKLGNTELLFCINVYSLLSLCKLFSCS